MDEREILDKIYRDNKDYHNAMWTLIKKQNEQIADLTKQVMLMQELLSRAMGVNTQSPAMKQIMGAFDGQEPEKGKSKGGAPLE